MYSTPTDILMLYHCDDMCTLGVKDTNNAVNWLRSLVHIQKAQKQLNRLYFSKLCDLRLTPTRYTGYLASQSEVALGGSALKMVVVKCLLVVMMSPV